jgi:hypothetical protein
LLILGVLLQGNHDVPLVGVTCAGQILAGPVWHHIESFAAVMWVFLANILNSIPQFIQADCIIFEGHKFGKQNDYSLCISFSKFSFLSMICWAFSVPPPLRMNVFWHSD